MRCTSCKKELPISDFSLISNTNRPRSKCKKCSAEYARIYRKRKKQKTFKSLFIKSPIVVNPSLISKICVGCNQKKSLTEFHRKRKNNRLASWDKFCKECSKLKMKNLWKSGYRRPCLSSLEHRLMATKHSLTKNGLYNNKLPMTLIINDIKSLIIRQTISGKLLCPITGLEMIDKKDNPLQPSIDRIDNSKGYTRHNIRLVPLIYNVGRNKWSDSKIKQAITKHTCGTHISNLAQLIRDKLRRKKLNINNVIIKKHDGAIICALSGLKLSPDPKSPLYPSIDRIDSKRGYVVGNVHLTSTIANLAKNHWPIHVFRVAWRKMVLGIKNGDGLMSAMFFDDEIKNKNNIISHIISNKKGAHTPFFKLRPHKCQLKFIDNAEASPLYKKYHYIGSTNSKYNIGVFYHKKLIACLSIRKPTRQKSGDWEISRMVCHNNYKVYGLWSYIIKWIKTNGVISGKLITFSDNRIFAGNVYVHMGMKFENNIKPDYYWVKNGKRYNKSSLRKTKAEKLTNKTETELRLSQGYHKIWDIGKRKWMITI